MHCVQGLITAVLSCAFTHFPTKDLLVLRKAA